MVLESKSLSDVERGVAVSKWARSARVEVRDRGPMEVAMMPGAFSAAVTSVLPTRKLARPANTNAFPVTYFVDTVFPKDELDE
jgi:hypothetical protein